MFVKVDPYKFNCVIFVFISYLINYLVIQSDSLVGYIMFVVCGTEYAKVRFFYVQR